MQLDQNPDWREIQKPNIGNIIHLKDSRNLGRLYKCIVTDASDAILKAEVDCVFALDGSGEIVHGEGTEFKGKAVVVERSLVWKVIES